MNALRALLFGLSLAIALAGCRPTGGDSAVLPSSTSSTETAPTASASAEDEWTPNEAVDAEAPARCGFPPGTELEFAGRATTAGLGVQEAVGDPMSDDPADIYVTRHRYAQGENFGRLVCAIFVNEPDFVEITVHPQDDPFVPPTPAPAGQMPDDGLDRDAAVSIALQHVGGDPQDWEVAVANPGSVARMLHEWDRVDWAADVDAEHWVWRIFLVRGDEGVDVFIDFVDGTVLGELRYIVN
jgi:hypothetical protein